MFKPCLFLAVVYFDELLYCALLFISLFLSYEPLRDKPLAMYIFSRNEADRDLIISNTSCGGICVNDTMGHFAGCTISIKYYAIIIINICLFINYLKYLPKQNHPNFQLNPYHSEVSDQAEWEPITESMDSIRLRTRNPAWWRTLALWARNWLRKFSLPSFSTLKAIVCNY